MSFLANARVLLDQVQRGFFSGYSFDPTAIPSELLSHLTPTEFSESIQRINAAAAAHPRAALALSRLSSLVSFASFLVFLNWLVGWSNYLSSNQAGGTALWVYLISLLIHISVNSHLATERRRRLAVAAANEHGKYMNRFPQLSWRISHLHHRRATLEVEKQYPVVPQASFVPQDFVASAQASSFAQAPYVAVEMSPAPSAPVQQHQPQPQPQQQQQQRSVNNSDGGAYYPVLPANFYRMQ